MDKLIKLAVSINLDKGRSEQVAERDYSVYPCVALVEGVHNRILFEAKEINHFPVLFDGRPVCVNHPQSLTASTPEYFATETLGVTMKSEAMTKEDGRGGIQTELWIDLEKASVLGYEALVDSMNPDAGEGQIMEVSCGIFANFEKTPGTWNGEEYDVIARNIRYDHLALLPDVEGACGADDPAGGCGVRWLSTEDIQKTGTACCDSCAEGDTCEVPSLNNNMKDEKMDNKTLLQKLTSLVKGQAEPKKAWLELGADDKRQQIWQLLKLEGADEWLCWPVEIFEDAFIYEQLCNDWKYRFYRRPYSVDANDQVSLGDKNAEFEVVPMRKIEWVEPSSLNNSNETEEEAVEMADNTENKEVSTEGKVLSEERMAAFERFEKFEAEEAAKLESELEGLRKTALAKNDKLTMSQLSAITDKDVLIALGGDEEEMEEDEKDMKDDEKEDMSKKDTPAETKKADFSINGGGDAGNSKPVNHAAETSVMLRKLHNKGESK